MQKRMNLVTGVEAEREKCRIVRPECELLQKKIVEHNQTIADDNTLQLKSQCAKKEWISLLGKHNASEEKVKTMCDNHLKSMGEITKMGHSTSKKMDFLYEQSKFK